MSAGSLSLRTAAIGATTLVLVALSACHPARRAEPLVGPMTLADTSLLRGRLLFDRHCYKCHLEGEGGMGPIMNDKPLPTFLIKMQVRAGLGAMPGFTQEQISDDELDDLANYTVFLRHHYSKRSD